MSDFSDFIKDYSFDLPDELIAQSPSPHKESARLLVVRRNPEKGLPKFEDLLISDLPHLVKETPALNQSLWVRNRSCVLPARFYAHRPTGSRHEIVLLEEVSSNLWKALIRNTAKMSFPQELFIDGLPKKEGHIICPEPGFIDFKFLKQNISSLLEHVGEMPLPPYIKERSATRDKDRYQSVWALRDEQKSVAAPTASLHFTNDLVSKLNNVGINFADTLLHVGLGTFEPVRCERLSEHSLHSERIFISSQEFHKINAHLLCKKPVLAVGTTALRNLESLPLINSTLRNEVELGQNSSGDWSGRTKLFVKPGFEFRFTNSLFTNFHLPESTLFVLVSTFAQSRSLAIEAYRHAISKNYRFFSYGDASLWI